MSNKLGICLVLSVMAFGLMPFGGGEFFRFPPSVFTSELRAGDKALPADPLQDRFASQVQPFLKRYCFACHGANKPKASLDLTRDATVMAIAKNARQWELVLDRLHAKEM